MGAVIGPAIGAGIGAAAARSPILGAISGMGNVANQGLGAVQGVKVPTPFSRVMEALNASTADPSSAAFANNVSSLPKAPTISAGSGIGPQSYRNAIAKIESGGRYDALGVETKGDRAYGKYQIMGNNIGPWTKQALGTAMTPQQFLANPAAQDATFDYHFGNYVNKYGPEGAAQAWLGGPGSVGKGGRVDAHGTSVQNYGQQFMANLGGTPPMASAGTGVSASASPFAPQGGAVGQSAPMALAGPSQTQDQKPSALERVVSALLEGGKGGTGPQAQMAEMGETAPAVDLGAEEVAANQQALQQRLQIGSQGAASRKAGIRQRVGYKA